MSNDRRRAVRYVLPGTWVSWDKASLWARLRERGKPRTKQKVLDVSVLGLAFATPQPPAEDSRIRLHMHMPDGDDTIESGGRVAVVVGMPKEELYRVGVEFSEAKGQLAGKLRIAGTPLAQDGEDKPANAGK